MPRAITPFNVRRSGRFERPPKLLHQLYSNMAQFTSAELSHRAVPHPRLAIAIRQSLLNEHCYLADIASRIFATETNVTHRTRRARRQLAIEPSRRLLRRQFSDGHSGFN